LNPAFSTQTVPALDTVIYNLTVTNNGVLPDSYSLAISNNAWATTLWNQDGSAQIAATGVLLGNVAHEGPSIQGVGTDRYCPVSRFCQRGHLFH
jgi:hypothetical protein